HAPPAAAEVLKRGMSRDRVDRQETACQLADELAEALEGDVPPPARRPVPQAPPVSPREEPAEAPRKRSLIVPVALAATALLVGAIIALAAGGGGGSSKPKQAAKPHKAAPRQQAQKPHPKPAPGPAAKPAPPPPQTASAPADGASLNSQGFRLMSAGRYAEAVPVLRKAVAAFPSGSTDLDYAYALFNLGKSLRLAGRPAEAIPVLERRLRIPNQTDVVKRELDQARRAAKP
ncbi:MAG TPA: tetratricopeptide repeat protein, partial [Thermoleophilaceae bacterium]